MHSWVMRPLAKRLEQQGFATVCFGYYSVWQSVSAHGDRLASWLDKRYDQSEELYLVGHSLGGLVIRDFLHRYPDWQVPRVVTIGTPHNGSLSAERLKPLAPSFMGRAYTLGLDGQVPPIRAGVALGSIAGSVSAGLGKLILPNNAMPNDGTVFVHETQVANACDHIIVSASHTGMIFDPQVARQVGHFLREGSFQRLLDE